MAKSQQSRRLLMCSNARAKCSSVSGGVSSPSASSSSLGSSR